MSGSPGRVANSQDETPVFFPAGEETLFGILTNPTVASLGVVVILVYGGAYNMTANVNRLWLRSARRLAGEGFHVLRYDYHGIGDSTGRAGVFDHRAPHTEDLRGAIDFLRGEGFNRLVVVGDCLGARASLVCAPDVQEIEALLMLVPLVRDGTKGKDEQWASAYGVGHYLRRGLQLDTLRRLSDPKLRASYRRVAGAKLRQMLGRGRDSKGDTTAAARAGDEWVSHMFLDLMERTLDRQVRMDILFGSEDLERRADFDRAVKGRLGGILAKAGPRVGITTVQGSVAGITDLVAQDAIVEHVTSWVSGVVSR